MKILRYIAYALFLAVLLPFCFRNTQPVRVELLPGHRWEAPLILVLFVFFAAGAALGVGAVTGWVLKQRREIQALRRGMNGPRPEALPAVPPDPGT